jgi:hypothetical protein
MSLIINVLQRYFFPGNNQFDFFSFNENGESFLFFVHFIIILLIKV